jgi:serine/threonine protein kinase/formylglycine-generating enzyme required for sulfatase activity
MVEPSRVEELFFAALAKGTPEERAAYLDDACRDEPELRQRVDKLLAAHPHAKGFLEPPVGELGPTVDSPKAPSPAETIGSRIGPYKLLQRLGEGGMGVVYLAEQEQPVKRRVALKIIKSGMDSAQVVARFEQERQALAMMDHPNIAKVLDAGATETGRLFFVMELVKGIPITRFCDQEHLTPHERLALFVPVCQAVQHAHQKGIIHRDLKPSNVLIALYDGKPVPKVIDFGVAKATHQKLTERTMFTEIGRIVGTLEYMAPEQAELNNLDIDTRADIYSLGVLLYELLTGGPPFSSKQLRGTAFTEMLRMIREVEPPKPSTRLSSSDELPSIAANRKLEPRRLTSLVTGELDWIVMKALEKDRARRYETANGLAMDIGRYLSDEPVLAGPPSAAYRLKKLMKRNKGRVAAAAAVAALLLVGVVALLVGIVAIRAEQRRTAEALAQVTDEQAKTQEARATGLVDSLVSADVAQVPQILKELECYRRRVTPSLVALAGTDPKTVDEHTAQLHARLALVKHDERQVPPLVEELLAGHATYVGVIRDQLVPYKDRIQINLWESLHDGTIDPTRRFHAGLALAKYASASEQWTPADCAFLAAQLVAANPEHQPRLREYLRPLDNRLLADLERIFADLKATESHQLSAANALADFSAKDTARLARLLSAATPGQYAILYPVVAEARDTAARAILNALVREAPAVELPQLERVALGKRRAGAAITLLRHGERESILDVLRGDPGGGLRGDPELLTQFVHRCRQRGILATQLLECLKLADQRRESTTGEARRIEDRVLYALLLALGEFELTDLPEAGRAAFVDQLAVWHAKDVSSAIHGATGWLLRHWKQDELARKVDQTPVAYAPDRQWYTLKFVALPSGPAPNADANSSPTPPESSSAFYITFVVFPAGEYTIGSALDEADRAANELRHVVKLTRPIAVSDREITWEQFNSLDDRGIHAAWEQQFGHALTADEPAFGVSWYEAVDYCRRLTKSAGMPEDDQAYIDPASLDRERFPADPDPVAYGAPRNWPLNVEQRGFRLPTEAEWEMVCRGGTNTAYSFGDDAQLLGRYGWFADNSEKWSHAVGRLRPSARGLFDIHGNLYEWSHDWNWNYDEAGAEDPTGPADGGARVIRGGGWSFVAADCRAAKRDAVHPANRSVALGFRVAAVPFSEASQSASQAETTGAASAK